MPNDDRRYLVPNPYYDEWETPQAFKSAKGPANRWEGRESVQGLTNTIYSSAPAYFEKWYADGSLFAFIQQLFPELLTVRAEAETGTMTRWDPQANASVPVPAMSPFAGTLTYYDADDQGLAIGKPHQVAYRWSHEDLAVVFEGRPAGGKGQRGFTKRLIRSYVAEDEWREQRRPLTRLEIQLGETSGAPEFVVTPAGVGNVDTSKYRDTLVSSILGYNGMRIDHDTGKILSVLQRVWAKMQNIERF
jgi:hypothetical protein